MNNEVDIGRAAGKEIDGEEVLTTKKGFGEVFVGTTGKTSSVMDVVRILTGVREERSSETTLYTVLLDMCRTQTKGAQEARVLDINFVNLVELEKRNLTERVIQIFAAQLGAEAAAGGSLIQRIDKQLKEKRQNSLRLKDFRLFNNRRTHQKVDIKWPRPSAEYDFHDMNFPMGGELDLEGEQELEEVQKIRGGDTDKKLQVEKPQEEVGHKRQQEAYKKPHGKHDLLVLKFTMGRWT